MSVNLQKGQKVSLTKEAPQAHRILVGLGWDAKKKGLFGGGSDFDLDASCFALRNGRLTSKKDICYFGNRNVMKKAIYHHGDNLTGAGDGDDEQITVDLDKLDSDVDKIVFVVNIYMAKMRRQSFGDVKNAFIRLVDEKTDTELFRYNLSDGVMLKDNHIAAAGAITNAVKMAKNYASFVRKIEVEVENLDMVKEAVEAGADIIMLDNMSVEEMKEAIRIIDGRAQTECSGNVTKENIDRLTSLGVDYISSGALTHSAPVLDISLKNLHAI